MGINNSQICLFGTELSATVAGSATLIGTLPQNPVTIIFDNQSSTTACAIYVDGTAPANLWRTFPAGEGLVLDLKDKAQSAPNFTPQIGTTFYGTGGGVFSISYIYAQNM